MKENMKGKSFESVTADWEGLLGAVLANQEELAHIDDLRAQLETRLEGLPALQLEKARLRVMTHQATQDFQGVLDQGHELVTRIRDGVRAHYGPRSEKLAEFGINAWKGRQATCPGREAGKGSPESIRTVE
jgi:hypothetical protein